MVYQVKSEKELKALQKPSRRLKIDAEVEGGSKVIERIEKRLAKLERLYKQDHVLLFKVYEQLEELKRRMNND